MREWRERGNERVGERGCKKVGRVREWVKEGKERGERGSKREGGFRK